MPGDGTGAEGADLSMKKARENGFTMAEMLIVVAIIVVLVSVSIPVFSRQLTKAQLAAETANLRSAYAEAIATALLETQPNSDGRYEVQIVPRFQYSGTTAIADNSANKVTVTLNAQTEEFSIDPNVLLTISGQAAQTAETAETAQTSDPSPSGGGT